MSDLIKKVRVRKQDGTITDYIPIGAEASNIDVDGESVKLKLNKKPYYYNSIADMKADEKLKAGDMAVTLGYYKANDGGAGEYHIISGEYTDDGGSYHELNNGLFAKLIIKNNTINIQQFGCYLDSVHDDTLQLQKLFNNAANLSIFTINGKINNYALVNTSIYIPCNLTINNLYIKVLNSNTQNNFIYPYVLLLNTHDAENWVISYNDWTTCKFNNIHIWCDLNLQLNGIYSCMNLILDRFFTRGCNCSFRQGNQYLDNMKIYNVNISLKILNAPAISCGYGGDGCIIDGVHIHDTYNNGTNNLININNSNAFTTNSGKYPMQIKNIINGYISLGYGMYELSQVHCEGATGISLHHGIFNIHDIEIYEDNINSQLSRSYTY